MGEDFKTENEPKCAAPRYKGMDDNELLKLDQLADLMDNKFVIPGTDIRVGLDSIIGLVPGIGDTASLAVSAYIIMKARQHGVHPWLISRMTWNVMIDFMLGLVPLAGDIFDVGWKANRRNVDLLKAHFKARAVEVDEKGRALFI